MFILRVFICLFFLLFIHVGQAKACSVGDNCPERLCSNKTPYYYGAASEEGGVYNYEYYDLIYIAENLWQYSDFSAYAQKVNYRKMFIPYRVIEMIKNNTSIMVDKDGILQQLIWSGTEKDGAEKYTKILKRRTYDGKIIKSYQCPNGLQFEEKGPYLIFAKQFIDEKQPTLIRKTHIPSNLYNKDKLQEADIVFSGVLKTSAFYKSREPRVNGESASYTISEYHVREVHKGKSEHQGKDIKYKLKMKVEPNLKAKYPTIYQAHKDKGFDRGVVVYLKKNPNFEEVYDVIFQHLDIEFELDVLRGQK